MDQREGGENRWLQGGVLPPESIVALMAQGGAPSDWAADDTVIVVSHSCDLNSGDFEAEPRAELIRAHIIEETDGNYTFGKNPRKLHVSFTRNGEEIAVSLDMNERAFVDRRILLQQAAPAPPDPEATKHIRSWLGRRYDRAAYPDAFNARLGPTSQKVRAAMKQRGRDISALFLRLSSDEELPDDSIYEVTVLGVMPTAAYDEPERRDTCQRGLDDVVTALHEVDGIEVEDAELTSDAEVTLEDLSYFQRWDFLLDLTMRDPTSALNPPA